MTANVGTIDRIARVIIGIALIAFALGFIAPGTNWAWIGWIGVVPLPDGVYRPARPITSINSATLRR